MVFKYTLLLVVTFILNSEVSGAGPCDGYWLLDGDCPEHEGKVYFDDESKTCNTNVAYELNDAQHVNCFQEGHQFASIDECKQTCLGIGIPEITTEVPEVTTEIPEMTTEATPEVPEIPADILENLSGIHGDAAGIPETPEISETLISNPEIPTNVLENLSGVHGNPSGIPETPEMLEISTKEIGTQTTENLQQSIQYLQLKIQRLQLKIQKIQFRIQTQLIA